jgi:hypothetical protein
MSKNKPQQQTIAEVKDVVETNALREGASPAEARSQVSKLGIAMKKHRDMEAALVALVERQDALTLADFHRQFIEIVKASNVGVVEMPKIVAKSETIVSLLEASGKRAEAVLEG